MTHTISAEKALLPVGWAASVAVTLEDGRIVAVESASEPASRPADHHAAILLPAPGNLHSHAFQRALAGLTEARGPEGADSFWSWRRQMFAFLERLTPDDVESIAAFAQMEMLEEGYAAVAEFHYLHHRPDGGAYDDPAEMAGRIAAAAERTGIGLTLLPVLYEQGGCDGRALGPGQRRFGSDPEGFARLLEGAASALRGRPDARLGVAPHSLRAVSPAGLAAAEALAEGLAPEAPIHLHLAEQQAEVAEVIEHLGARPATWLLDSRQIGPRWCLIHCTQTSPAEIAGLAASGAVAGLCPVTEANLGDGIFDATGHLAAGGRIGMGTDSNIRIGLAGELRALEYSQRLRDRGRALLAAPGRSTGRRLYEAAAEGGAQALARASGRIAPGAWADLVALDPQAPDLAGRSADAILDAFLVAGDRRMIADVWSAGRHVVANGRHRARDTLTEAFRATMTHLLA